MADDMELWVVGAVLGAHLPVEATDAPAPGEDRWGGLPDVVAERARALRNAKASRAEDEQAPTLTTIPRQRGAQVGT